MRHNPNTNEVHSNPGVITPELDQLLKGLSDPSPTCTAVSAGGICSSSRAKPAAIAADDSYRFPSNHPDFAAWLETYADERSETLARRVASLSREAEFCGVRKQGYEEVRVQLCALGVALNQQGKIAPAFRDMIQGSFKKAGQPAEPTDAMIMRDRQVIDLHWVFLHEEMDGQLTHEDLTVDGGFNFSRAGEIACLNWGTDKKIVMLGLDASTQTLLSFYRWKTMREAMTKFRKSQDRTLEAIQRAKTHSDNRRTERATALLDVYLALCLANGKIDYARFIIAKMGHSMPSSDYVRRARTWLENKAKLSVLRFDTEIER